MQLAAGSTDEAAVALDRADFYLDTYGQRYPEGLLLLLRARLLQARGEPAAVVRAAAERARALSTEREAHLFARRAEEFLMTIDVASGRRIHKVSTARKDDPDRFTSERGWRRKTFVGSYFREASCRCERHACTATTSRCGSRRYRCPTPGRTRC